MITCRQCGRESADDALFCAVCGVALAAAAPREERKVVTVVFVDLVGSTARAEHLDPEDVRAILAPYHARVRHELERIGGTVEKFIGDAVVAVFGAPVAHEDDPERAVRAALAIQEAIADLNEADPALELEVRVGVNTGEALVDLAARPELGEGMVSGDVINTAARLQSAAPPGGILVGDQTHRATERVIEYAEHAPVEAKGKSAPVGVWQAIGARARVELEADAAGRAQLVGRARELALLADALGRVRSDERPQLVTLVGVPGIGKSRLVHELSEIVDADPDLITWRRGRSLPYGEGVAYWALGEIVKAQAGVLESDDADDAAAKLALAVTTLLEEPTEAAWVERNLRPLVGLPGGEGQPSRVQAFAAWRRFLEALAERGPAVLVFEDLHWADDDLLDFVDELTDRLDAVPLLLVCTARSELLARRPGWGGGKLNAVTLSLAPLSEEETARLLHELLRHSVLPAEMQAAIVERAEGVPLFAEEYVRMLEAGETSGALPDTLQGIVAARVDGLPSDEKALLQDAAVLGRVFWTDALRAVSGVDAERGDELIRALERKEFVRRERRSAVEGARQYLFLHALVRDISYGQIPRAARAAKHRATADWISALPTDRAEDRAEMLAHHLESAIGYGESAGLDVADLRPRAVAALRDAGDRAWALNIVSRAARLYRRALDATPDAEPDPELLFLHGRALFWAEGVSGDPTHDLERAIDGLAASGRPELAALAAVALERYLWNVNMPRPDLYDRALDLVAGMGPTRDRAEVLAHVAVRWAIMGRAEEALPLAEQAVAIARTQGDLLLEGQALNAHGVALSNAGRLDEGIVAVRQSLELGLETGSYDTPRAFVNLASLQHEAGLLAAAEATFREGLAFAQRFEQASHDDWVQRELVMCASLRGDWDEVLRQAEPILALARDRGESHLLDAFIRLAVAAIVAAREGRVLEGEIADALRQARAVGDPQLLLPVLGDAALVLADAGHVASARELLDELGQHRSGNAYFVIGGMVACALLGAAPLPERLLGAARTPWVDACELLARGDSVGAADVLAAMGARPYEALVRFHAATAPAVPDPGEAARQLELACAFWRSVGATARLARAEDVRARLRLAAS